MTTPQTPAGWYSDPDGSGGQRYWDGYTWTDHRAPAPQAPPPPPPPPASPPSPPPPSPPPAAPERVGGAHRAPEPEDEDEDLPEDLPEPPEQSTTPDDVPSTPVESVDDSAPSEATSVIPTSAPSEATSAIPTSPPPLPPPTSPPPTSPPPFSAVPTAGTDRPLLMRYLAVCAALLAVAVAVGVYAAFFADDGSAAISASNPTTSQTSTPATAGDTSPTATETETETTEETSPTETGDPTDGAFAYSVHGFEVGTTVTSADAPIEKTAVGEYVVVHMTVTNIGDVATPFLGTFQKLLAGGTVYSIDDEATFYLGGGMAELNPGDQVDVAVAFDVPPGTTPEAIELHTDPLSPGIQVPLS